VSYGNYDNLILRRSGSYTDNVSFSTNTVARFHSTEGYFPATLQNSIIEGDLGYEVSNSAFNGSNWTINNCTFRNYRKFPQTLLTNARFNNCNFFGQSGLVQTQTPSSPATFTNCYFSGKYMFSLDVDELYAGGINNSIFNHCVFDDAYISDFSGKMIDCLLSSITAGKPVIFCDGNNGANPHLYNCTIVNNSTFPSCISGANSAVITMAHCRLNKNITGSFSQPLPSGGFSIVNSNISLS
jgi:uncharacterized protein YjbI with pentapeptide repeats